MTIKIKYNSWGVPRLLFWILIGFMSAQAFANQSNIPLSNTSNQAWFKQDPKSKQEVQLQVDLFLSTTCSHCQAADRYFHQLEAKKHWLSIHRYYINQDTMALDRLHDLVQAQKITINPFAVPAIFFCNTRWLGFDTDKQSGREILKELTYCHQQILATGKLAPMTVNAIQKNVVSGWYESHILKGTTWPTLILTLSVLDALMPCSLVAFLVILAFLFLTQPISARLILSGLCLLCIGLVHYFQEVHTASFYDMIRAFRGISVGLGLCLFLVLVFQYRQKQSYLQFDCSLKGIALGCLAILTVAGVYSYSQGCAPNYALVFQQYLATQTLSSPYQFMFIFIYQLIYLLTLAILLLIALAVVIPWIKYQALLRKIVYFILFFFAGFLLVYPVLLE